MKKRILSILLTLVMVIGMLPVASLTAHAEGSGDDCYIEIDGTKIDDLNNAASGSGSGGGTWTYTPGTIPTITLNNYAGGAIGLYKPTPEFTDCVEFRIDVYGDCIINNPTGYGISLSTSELLHYSARSNLYIYLADNASLSIDGSRGIENTSFWPTTWIQGFPGVADCNANVNIDVTNMGIVADGTFTTDAAGNKLQYVGEIHIGNGLILDVKASTPFLNSEANPSQLIVEPLTVVNNNGAMVSMTSTTGEDFIHFARPYRIPDEYTAYKNASESELLLYIPAEPEFKNQNPAGNDDETTDLNYTVGDTATFTFDSDTPNGFTAKKSAKLKGLSAGLDAAETVTNETDSALSLEHTFENAGLYQLTETLELYFGSVLAGTKTHTFLISVFDPLVRNIDVSATFSGTPADATTSTTGAEVTETKWYKQNGSSWTELVASDTIKEGGTYRCEVTVAATGDYILADGYTVKISGINATNKSGNTWYVDKSIAGYLEYADVEDITLPEAGVKPDFTTYDIQSAYTDFYKIEWYKCDKDGKKIGNALSADDKFEANSYYRVEVTMTPAENYDFNTKDLTFAINGKSANYYYPYHGLNGGVTGWTVYHTDEVEGSYELYVRDNSTEKDFIIKNGQYLASASNTPSATKPASGGYAYYNNGVLTLNNYDNEAAHFVFEEGALDVYLVGDNTIGAITDNDGDTSMGKLEHIRPGNLVIDAADGGKLVVAGNPLNWFCTLCVYGDLYINGGEVAVHQGEQAYQSIIANSINVAGSYGIYASNTDNYLTADEWDYTSNISSYKNVWIVPIYKVWFWNEDNSYFSSEHVAKGRTATRPADPEDPIGADRLFLGWYADEGDLFDFDTPITGTTHLTARFKDHEITTVAVNVTAPVADETPSYTATVPNGAGYTFHNKTGYVNGVMWEKKVGGGYTAMASGEKFVAGQEYLVTVLIEPKAGYEFYYAANNNTTEPNVTATVNGKSATFNKDSTWLMVQYRFTANGTTITGSTTNGIKVKVENLKNSATLMVAQYEGGKMVDVQTKAVSADGTYTMDKLTHKSGYTYKAFLMDSTTYAPLCDADTF